jgi:chemotaxis signal transduction protein
MKDRAQNPRQENRSAAVKESPQEIGFVIGSVVGIIWLVWANIQSTRNGGTASYIFIIICGGIGWGIGRIVSRLL